MGKKKISVVFISGSRDVKELTKKMRRTINNRVLKSKKKKIQVIVGDCYGVDTLVQNYLIKKGFTNIFVYHIGKRPRFMNTEVAGSVNVHGNNYTDKDKLMCDHCHKAIVICRNNSKGSMANVKRLKKMNKKTELIKVK